LMSSDVRFLFDELPEPVSEAGKPCFATSRREPDICDD
jgi:hypothetical protein